MYGILNVGCPVCILEGIVAISVHKKYCISFILQMFYMLYVSPSIGTFVQKEQILHATCQSKLSFEEKAKMVSVSAKTVHDVWHFHKICVQVSQ